MNMPMIYYQIKAEVYSFQNIKVYIQVIILSDNHRLPLPVDLFIV